MKTIFGLNIDYIRENITNICVFIMVLNLLIFIFVFFIRVLSLEDVEVKSNILSSNNIEIIKINNCEYLKFPINGSMYSFVHKGDCSNLIHTYCIINLEKSEKAK